MTIETVTVAAVSGIAGIVSALGAGFAAWGGLRSDVSHHADQIEALKIEVSAKADKAEMREGFGRIEYAMQSLTARIDRFLEGRR